MSAPVLPQRCFKPRAENEVVIPFNIVVISRQCDRRTAGHQKAEVAVITSKKARRPSALNSLLHIDRDVPLCPGASV